MFTKFHISNFRTHLNTELSVKDLTLIIGSNNSGKSNLLAGLRFFSKLVSNAFPESYKSKAIKSYDYYSNKHSLSAEETPILLLCEWERGDNKIFYSIELYVASGSVWCREKLQLNKGEAINTYQHGVDEKSKELLLRTIVKEQQESHSLLLEEFFRSLAFLYYYNFQPLMLKGQAFTVRYENGETRPANKRDFIKEFRSQEGMQEKRPNLASEIGKDGANFQELIKYVKEEEGETYNKFLGFLKRFENSFVGLHTDRGQVKWQFDMGNSNFPYFDPDKISDGLVKAAAVALLCAMRRPPSIIMIEEVENGINQRNLKQFLQWLVDTSEKGNKTQFILTSHSPSVVREFSDRIDSVYNVHLKRKKGYISEVTNLNEAINPLVRLGTIEEDAVTERDGVYHIRPHALTELFYNGVLAEL